MRASVPLTKYAALDENVREYLLYTLINAHATLGKELMIPDFLKRRLLSSEEYAEYGKLIAGQAPLRYGVPLAQGGVLGA